MHAITGFAGVNLNVGDRHDYGIDFTIKPVVIIDGTRVETGHPIDLQLKSTVNWSYDNHSVVYDLSAEAYNKLVSRGPNSISYLLVLLCLPPKREDWLKGSEQELLARNCCYWQRLEGCRINNKQSKRIRIPRSNLLTPESIIQLVENESARWDER